MLLSCRLKTAADMVGGGRVADIGCDHAYVSIYLMECHKADKVIAMDVNPGPLKIARENIKRRGYGDRIETRLSNGVSQLKPNEVDVLFLAGMGGGLIVKILSEGREIVDSCKELILQPQSEIAQVRRYLRTISYKIVDEAMLVEGAHYYTILKAVKEERGENGSSPENSSDSNTEIEFFDLYGRILLETKNAVLKEYLEQRQRVDARILETLDKAGSIHAEERMAELRKELYYIKEGLKVYEV